MHIIKFDHRIHSIQRAAELILSAYDLSSTENDQTRRTVMSLIESGDNFLGHENMYISMENGAITGLIICYAGKSGGTLRALIRLLTELRLKELINLIILNAELLHTGYTPELTEDDFYISIVVVDEKQRGKGLGTKLIHKAIEIAKEKGCRKAVLDVDSDNGAARALYEKLGFTMREKSLKSIKGAVPSEIYTMVYTLGNTDSGERTRGSRLHQGTRP